MLLMGTAGTGKSFIIKQLQKVLKHRVQTLGTTGMASFLIDGVTAHSLLNLPIRGRRECKMGLPAKQRLEDRLEHVKYIIIDEISMCSKKMFWYIDNRLRQASKQPGVPFGGKNIILVGDFGQLPPIGGKTIYEKPLSGASSLHNEAYNLYMDRFKTIIKLQTIKRQVICKTYIIICKTYIQIY